MKSFQDEVAAAQPDIDARTEQLVSKGRWAVPGYKASSTSESNLIETISNLHVGEIWRFVGSLSGFYSVTSYPHGLYYVSIASVSKYQHRSHAAHPSNMCCEQPSPFLTSLFNQPFTCRSDWFYLHLIGFRWLTSACAPLHSGCLCRLSYQMSTLMVPPPTGVG